MTSSGAALESRASAPTPKARAVGTKICRLIARSGSLRGGTGITRSRLMVNASGCAPDPAAMFPTRSVGKTVTSRIRTGRGAPSACRRISAKPTWSMPP